MMSDFRYAWKQRKAWLFTAHAKNKARFARTLLGGYWFGISNLLTILLLSLFYSQIFKVADVKNYLVYMGLGMVLWQTFTHAINGAESILSGNSQKIQSSNINPIYFACESWIFELHNFYQSFIIIVLSLAFIKPIIPINVLIYSIPSLVNFIIGMFWVPLCVSLIISRYKDLKQIIPVILHFLFLTSPILYGEERVGKLAMFVSLNPLYKIIAVVRNSIISGDILFYENTKILVLNVIGTMVTIYFLKKMKSQLPFLV